MGVAVETPFRHGEGVRTIARCSLIIIFTIVATVIVWFVFQDRRSSLASFEILLFDTALYGMFTRILLALTFVPFYALQEGRPEKLKACLLVLVVMLMLGLSQVSTETIAKLPFRFFGTFIKWWLLGGAVIIFVAIVTVTLLPYSSDELARARQKARTFNPVSGLVRFALLAALAIMAGTVSFVIAMGMISDGPFEQAWLYLFVLILGLTRQFAVFLCVIFLCLAVSSVFVSRLELMLTGVCGALAPLIVTVIGTHRSVLPDQDALDTLIALSVIIALVVMFCATILSRQRVVLECRQ